MSGAFIVFEGPDGAGTTFHSHKLAERLQREGKEAVLTFEPSDGKFGKEIRGILEEGIYIDPAELQKLFCEDRRLHLETVIQPALHAGKVVVCDRYVPSTFVYGEASEVSLPQLTQWNEGFPEPDLLFVLLPPLELIAERLKRRESDDPFEKEYFQKYVYDGYQKYAKEHPEAVVIDTSGGKEEVEEMIWKTVTSVL